MSKKIKCPVCNHETPHEGTLTICQSCGSGIMFEKDVFQQAWEGLTSEEKMVYAVLETTEIYKEIEDMDDDALVDELLHYLSDKSVDLQKTTENSLFNFTMKGKLQKMERKTLEGAYVLCHGNCALDVEGYDLYNM